MKGSGLKTYITRRRNQLRFATCGILDAAGVRREWNSPLSDERAGSLARMVRLS